MGRETIRQVLAHHDAEAVAEKKCGASRTLDAEYIACMEDVLNVLARPYDAPGAGRDVGRTPGGPARREPAGPGDGATAGWPERTTSTCGQAPPISTASSSPRPAGT